MHSSWEDKNLLPLWEKLKDGRRFTLRDGLILFKTQDLITLGSMASWLKRQINGDAVYFAVNQKIEPSNICRLSCRVCGFSVKKGDPRGYTMSIADALKKLRPEVREVHITGSLNPDLPWSYYLELLQEIKKRFPEVKIKAFTAVEIDHFHKKFGLTYEEVLSQLKAAGLDSLPGGGAEVFSERIRRDLFPRKIGAKKWLKIHECAHRLGILSNATILYGHRETYEERLKHLLLLRELQDRTGGFLAFVPLPFQPGRGNIKTTYTSAIEDLKMIAVSRLMLDNFPHIKAYWVMLTEEVAAAALHFGADDLEGTVGGEKIAHAAGALSPEELPKSRLLKIISEAGRVPVERDAYYHPLRVYIRGVIGKIPYLNVAPFHNYFDKTDFKLLPAPPRYLGMLARKDQIMAGAFSLMDFFSLEDRLEMLPFCIAATDTVKSVMLFSRKGISEIGGEKIGITDDTATSVVLLKLILKKKYGLTAEFVRIKNGDFDYSTMSALLLIGDEALMGLKRGIKGFPFVYDLANEWYTWQGLPFVFALWAVRKDASIRTKQKLTRDLARSLKQEREVPSFLSYWHGRRIGLTDKETREYLGGFIFELGPRERKAIDVFRHLVDKELTNER